MYCSICNATHVVTIFNIFEVVLFRGRDCLLRFARFGVSARHDIGASPPRIKDWPGVYLVLFRPGVCAGLPFFPVNKCSLSVTQRGLQDGWGLGVAVCRVTFRTLWRYSPLYGDGRYCWVLSAPVALLILFFPACTALYTCPPVVNSRACLLFITLNTVTVKLLFELITVCPVRL